MQWSSIRPEAGSRITERYSHCCCYYDKSLYVFGGCTATNTTLNDLWRFDLGTREWIRPLAMGTYPFPKACASLVVYKDNLVLFGGWSHPTPFPLHQAARFFSELHIYKPSTNRWSHVTTLSHQSPQPVAGHSASVIGDFMVVFGGSQVSGVRTNEVWLFDFNEGAWRIPHIGNRRPAPRYGQTQVTLDEKHILILGGCGGGTTHQIFNDCWLLTVGDEEWTWDEIHIQNTQWAAPQLWCHSACKVSNMIVTLSKPARPPTRTVPQSPRSSKPRSKIWVPPREDEIPHDNSSAQFESRHPSEMDSDQSNTLDKSHGNSSNQLDLNEHEMATANPRPGLPSVRPNAMKNRQKQLEALLKYEKRVRHSDMTGPSNSEPGPSRPPNLPIVKHNKITSPVNIASLMVLHVLDISTVVENKMASWQKINFQNITSAPEETIFYTLVEGQGELLMFGGIEKDIHSLQRGQGIKSHTVNNALHILSPIPYML